MALGNTETDSVFGDFVDLEHVCELLHEQAKVSDCPVDHPVHKNGPVRLLRQRMHMQWSAQAREIEAQHPGLFPRTYLAEIYDESDEILERIERYPGALPADLPRLELLLHKLYILSLLTHEDVQRAKAQQASAAAKASHDGRTKMRNEAYRCFLAAADGAWGSISAAATAIAPVILEMKGVSRPLAQSNAARTIRDWLSGLVASDPHAAKKLSWAARTRLKRKTAAR